MLSGDDYYVIAPALLAGCAWLLWDRRWQTVVVGQCRLTPRRPCRPWSATDVVRGGDPPTTAGAPEAGGPGLARLRDGFLVWPVVVYVALRGLTLAALAVADLFTHDSFAARSTAGTGSGSSTPPRTATPGTCR